MLTLILGGARSGKSDFAQRLALASERPVLFVATMEPGDDENATRISAHRATRPSSWRTIEAPLRVVEEVASHAEPMGFLLLDCLTLWVSNLLIESLGDAEQASPERMSPALDAVASNVRDLLDWATVYDGEVAVVSNEVGLGVVPAYPLGRVYRDALGAANRTLAARADRVYWLVAGLALDIKAMGALPVETSGESRDQ